MTRKALLFLEAIFLGGLAFGLAYATEHYKLTGNQDFSELDSQLESAGTQLDQTIENLSPYLKIYKPEKSSPGFTLYPVEGGAKVQLLNMRGQIVHQWKTDAERARLLPDGNLLVVHGSKWGRNKKEWADQRTRLREYNWDGEIVWEYHASDVVHHDAWRLDNGNTILLRRTLIPADMQERILDASRRGSDIRSDSILEVTPGGEIVWEWHAHEQLDLNSCGKRGCDRLVGDADSADSAKDWTHVNTAMPLPENHWFDLGDRRFRPGNLLFLPRNWWTAFVADKESKQIVWKYEGDYRGGLGGGHEANMIPKGLPGAGNILIFDNGSGVHKGSSIALEINPSDNTIVWLYEASDFHSRTRGSIQRLPNGNTLLSEDVTGRAFEVTPEKEIVWSYQGPKPINRARRYAYDFTEKFQALEK